MDSLEYECPQCHGAGLGKQDHFIQLLDTCGRCGGSGRVDWISRVVSSPCNKVEESALHKSVMANIQLLKARIIEEGGKVGMYVKIDLEFKSYHDYMMKATSPMIIKGGKINVSY